MQENPYSTFAREGHPLFPKLNETGFPSIRVILSDDDAMAFEKYHFAHGKTNRLTTNLVLITSVVVPLAISFDLLKYAPLGLRSGVAVTCSIIFAAMVYGYYRFMCVLMFRKLMRENPGMLGERDYRLENKCISEIATASEARYAYESLRIYDTPKVVYVYTNVGQTLIIPKNRIVEGNPNEFIAELQRRISNV